MLLKKFFSWIKSKYEKRLHSQKGEENMPVKSIRVPKDKIASTEFENHSIVSIIKRVGKEVVVVDSRGATTRISPKYLKRLKTSSLNNRGSVRIRANGLSRAQVGRIVGDLKEDFSGDVYIRKVSQPQRRLGKAQTMSFEILLKGDSNGESEK